jgi:hypothetical protein
MQKLFLFFFSVIFCSRVIAQENYDVIHYKYELELSATSDIITGKAVIRIKALQPLNAIDLDLHKERSGKGMKVQRIRQGEKDADRLRYVFTNDKLTPIFYDSLKKGEERELHYFLQWHSR